ncbi:hypothetical protein GCM10023116_25850 [Kistimonas scapharcae]|uniref:HTH araC/xylS-type domain-containing protein n=1 Tax=Kistimonas scapharcae TaxID=1036133 RepID=A0ABP8V398_9GAMM
MLPIQQASLFFCLSLTLLNLILVTASGRREPVTHCFALLQLCLIAYLIQPLTLQLEAGFLVDWVVALGRNALPCIFWLVCLLAFNDEFRLNRRVLLTASVVALFGPMLKLVFHIVGYQPSLWINFFSHWIPQSIEFLLIGHALITIGRYLREDLIQNRRRLRGWLLGCTGFYIASVVLMEQLIGLNDNIRIMNSIMLAAFLLIFNALLLRFKTDLLYPARRQKQEIIFTYNNNTAIDVNKSEKPASADPIEDTTFSRLQSLMETEFIYREDSLTIGELAGRLNMQEYRLRSLINRQLGYRNFNDYLNHFRIREIRERLSDPNQKEIPILTIALEAGFHSLSAFNRAFKNRMGITPSQYCEERQRLPEKPAPTPLTDSETTD